MGTLLTATLFQSQHNNSRFRLSFVTLVRSVTVAVCEDGKGLSDSPDGTLESLSLSGVRPPRGDLVSFRSEGIPENNSNDTPPPSCGAEGLHNHNPIKINQF